MQYNRTDDFSKALQSHFIHYTTTFFEKKFGGMRSLPYLSISFETIIRYSKPIYHIFRSKIFTLMPALGKFYLWERVRFGSFRSVSIPPLSNTIFTLT